MDQLINFNGVMVLLTTGSTLSEVQSFLNEAEVVLSVDQEVGAHILRAPNWWGQA